MRCSLGLQQLLVILRLGQLDRRLGPLGGVDAVDEVFRVVLGCLDQGVGGGVLAEDAEADECGALNDFLAGAPAAEPVCSGIAAMTSITDYAARAERYSPPPTLPSIRSGV